MFATLLLGCLSAPLPTPMASAGAPPESREVRVATVLRPQQPTSARGCSNGADRAFRADLELLTSPRAEGRGIGSNGEQLVVRHLVTRMRDLGLRPIQGLAQDGYVQEFLVPDPRPRSYLPNGTGCEIVAGPAPRLLRLGTEVVPHGGSADGDVTAEVVFAGHGLVIPDLQLDDYRGLDVRGRIVLVLRGYPQSEDGGVRSAKFRDARTFATKLANAQKAGAAGMLTCSRIDVRTPGDSLEWVGRASGDAAFPAMWIARACAEELLRADTVSGLGLADRQARLDRGEAGATGVLGGIKVHLRAEMGPRRDKLESCNVIGLLAGSDATLAREYLVVGAHHDHLGLGEHGSLGGRSAVGKVHPGADDNASGVAGMLELARRLAGGDRLRRSVLIVGFGAEEMWLRGSAAFLERCPVPREQIVAMLNLNMIGRGGSGSFRVEGVGSGLGLESLVRGVANARGREVPTRELASCRSDHLSFLGANVPSLLFHTGLHDQYHTPSDVMSLVEVPEALEIVGVAEDVVRALDRLDSRPTFTGKRGRFTGTGR